MQFCSECDFRITAFEEKSNPIIACLERKQTARQKKATARSTQPWRQLPFREQFCKSIAVPPDPTTLPG
ncbi:hypothetical protein J2046_003878 [Rhizobium petrolearium]|nr:hypothetical protein [Neorhizobium petrolearium]